MVSEVGNHGPMENANGTSVSPIPSPASSSLLLTAQKANFVTFHHPIFVKLDEKNFLVWRQQTLAAIYGHDLARFIDESADQLSKFANSEDELTGKVSEDFTAWIRQDQLLLSWLLSSMSDSMLTRVVGCETSSMAWERIQ